MRRKAIISLLGIFLAVSLQGQNRLELLETNIPKNKFPSYGDSYLWSKNWWLGNAMLVDTSKGGNSIAANSLLSKKKIDSLSKEFLKYISVDVLRFGPLQPRINFLADNKVKPYIKASIYEINSSSTKLIVQFVIEFGKGVHNSMPDVIDIRITKPTELQPYTETVVRKIFQRKAIAEENNLIGPTISRN